MKIYQALEILKNFSPNDEILVPCGEDKLTDCFSILAVRAGANTDNLRHVGLLPQEGNWKAAAGGAWTKAGIPAPSEPPVQYAEGLGLKPLTEAQKAVVKEIIKEREKDPSVGARKVCKACGKMDIPLDGDGRCSACILMAHGVRISGESARRPFTEAGEDRAAWLDRFLVKHDLWRHFREDPIPGR